MNEQDMIEELGGQRDEPEPLTEAEKKIVGQSFAVERCEFCGWFVKCPKCGNNCCNGGFGNMDKDGNPLPWNTQDKDAQPCDMCPTAYAVQDALHGEINVKVNYEELYYELLFQVESVHEGETRHQTALRYIKEREHSKTECEAKQNIQDNMTKF